MHAAEYLHESLPYRELPVFGSHASLEVLHIHRKIC